MALTDHCDVFGSVHEDGFNRIFQHIMLQRPSLFNYGTRFFAFNVDRMCREIRVHPEVPRRNNPLVTVEEPLPIPGTGGRFGMDFCAQLVDAKLDFHPSNVIGLPPELDPLDRQCFALTGEFCVGLACPNSERATHVGDVLADLAEREDGKRTNDEFRPPVQPLPGEKIICFCLEVYATLRIERSIVNGKTFLVPRLKGFEIVDIRPENLENAFECYVETVLRVGILPKLRFALDTLTTEMGGFLGLTPGLTPISANVPNNPAIENDQLKVFVDLGI